MTKSVDLVLAELSGNPLVVRDIANRIKRSYSATHRALCDLESAGLAKRKRYSTIHHWRKDNAGIL